MKKVILFLTLTVISLLLTVVPASAENNVSEIDVTAVLNKDGSADITAIWTGSFDEGTECYIPVRTEGGLDIKDLTVSDENGAFETLDSWDVDASHDEKTGKCGLNVTDDGYEVCWGIGDYGDNTYTVNYTVTGVVAGYSDSDGFNFMFINRGMNTGPTTASVTIIAADGTVLDNDNCKCWAFGFYGDIGFSAGAVVASTDDDLDEDSCMIIMLEFNKGIFEPERNVDGSFRDVKEEAFKGSDYSYHYDDDGNFVEGVYGYKDETQTIGAIITAVIFGSVAAAFAAAAISAIVRRVRFKRFYRDTDYYRDAPCGGNLDVIYAMGRLYGQCTEGSIVGARIMRMFDGGFIEIVTDTSVGAFGREKSEQSVHFKKLPDDENDRSVYELMIAAAGSDAILSRKEMERYCDRNPSRLRDIIDNSEMRGKIMMSNGGVKYKKNESVNKLSDSDRVLLSQLLGYKKYLLDFSLIAEREVSEVAVWKDMLIYATLLGIADKVADQLKQVYPQYVNQIDTTYTYSVFAYSYYNGMYSSMIARERREQAARSEGSGGSSSFGGGGGFSGGGFGGGTR